MCKQLTIQMEVATHFLATPLLRAGAIGSVLTLCPSVNSDRVLYQSHKTSRRPSVVESSCIMWVGPPKSDVKDHVHFTMTT